LITQKLVKGKKQKKFEKLKGRQAALLLIKMRGVYARWGECTLLRKILKGNLSLKKLNQHTVRADRNSSGKKKLHPAKGNAST